MNTSKQITRRILSGALSGLLGLSTFAVSAQDADKLAAANNGFAFDLLKQIAKEQPGENIFISPFSVSTALQMVGNGAAGETKTEMQHVLKTDGLKPAALNAACKSLNDSLAAQPDVILELANGIWYQNKFQLKPGFVADNKNFFGAELAGVDFADSGSAQTINDWADHKTHGKVQNVVQFPFDPDMRLLLANAIYFKGKWETPFDQNKTAPRDFHPVGGAAKQTPMMWQKRKFDYEEGDGFQAVRLAYAGDRLQMYLFLPAAGSGPQQLLAGFDGANWRDKILPQFDEREGTLVFPKFKINYEVLLNGPLKDLGMKRAFDADAADFSAMAGERLVVSKVKQKSFVAVDEEGTEAAAVTTVGITAMSIRVDEPKPFEMIVDRPFLFVIADGPTQSILFTGMVNDPTP
jgi:serpin B